MLVRYGLHVLWPCVLVAARLSTIACAAAPAADNKTAIEPATAPANKLDREPDVVWVATPEKVVDAMLEMAEIKKGDVVYDLGCGDGRILIAAAKRYGVRAKGFEIDPKYVAQAQEKIKTAGVEKLVTVERADMFDVDLSEATVVTLYLLPSLNVQLIPQLERLKPGSRIVSHDFDIRGIKTFKEARVDVTGLGHWVYLIKTPLERQPAKIASEAKH